MKLPRYRLRWCLAALGLSAAVAGYAQEGTTASEEGARQFNKCAACHSLERDVHLAGPSLADLSGRSAGGAEGYVYSPAMEQAGLKWTAETLDAFLADPQGLIPGNTMPFGALRNREQRDALVQFLIGR